MSAATSGRPWARRLREGAGVAARAIEGALRRFPIPALSILFFSIVSNVLVQSPDWLGWNAARLLAALSAAGFAALAIDLVAEARRIGVAKARLASLLAAALVFSAVWFATPFALYGPAVVLAGAVAVPILPFLGRGSSTHVWVFALWLTVGLVLATVAVLAVLAGVTAILEMVRALFGFGPGVEVYSHLFATATTLVGPLFALGRVPSTRLWDNRLEDEDRLVRALRPLLVLVGLPLVLAVALVYHVYLGRFVLGGDADRDTIASIGLGFLASALLLRIQIVPFLATGGAMARSFAMVWPWLLIGPSAALLFVALEPPAVPGLSLWRYYLAVAAAIFLTLSAVQVFRRTRADLRVLVLVPTLILLASTFGPWGAPSVIGRSQEHWLRAELGPVLDSGPGAIVDVPANTRYRMFSRIETLLDLGQEDRAARALESLVGRESGEGEEAFLARVRTALRLDEDASPVDASDLDEFQAPFPRIVDVGGFDRIVPRVPVFVAGGRVVADGVSLELAENVLILAVGDAAQRVPLDAALHGRGAGVDYVLDDGRRLRMWIESASRLNGALQNITVTLALRSADWPALR